MATYLDKRLFDNRLYDIDCSQLLDDDEEILSAVIAPLGADFGLMFGPCLVNPAPILYPLLAREAAAGKVVQVRISAGALPAGTTEQLATLRVRMVTSINPALETIVTLRLTDGAT